jgi:hypothetical protein
MEESREGKEEGQDSKKSGSAKGAGNKANEEERRGKEAVADITPLDRLRLQSHGRQLS